MTAYYNEIDPYAAQWLRNLIDAGHIAPGIVDERSIEDVRPSDLMGFAQCHFFAGVGVWSLALRGAGVPDDAPFWTGSCPCQPFSAAGKGDGMDDERHLWPAFFHLIEQCRPARVFGEQVASKDADPWIDLVQDDLEGVGYRVGAVPFPAASVGAPNIRDRLYWVADSNDSRLEGWGAVQQRSTEWAAGSCGMAGGMANADCSTGGQRGALHRGGHQRGDAQSRSGLGGSGMPVAGFWADADWIACRDDKWRPIEPGTFPLAHGTTSRVGRLRAYGNAINAKQAQAFIEAVMEAA